MGNLLSKVVVTGIVALSAKGTNSATTRRLLTSDTRGLTVFVRDDEEKLVAMELAADATADDLYKAAKESGFGNKLEDGATLLMSGQDIVDGPMSLADLGIAAEAVLSVSPPLPLANRLHLLLKGSMKPSNSDAMHRLLSLLEHCAEDSAANPQCSSRYLCQHFPYFVCDHNDDITEINLRDVPLPLMVNLRFLPSTVKRLDLSRTRLDIPSFDLAALRHKPLLEELDLSQSYLVVRNIDLKELRGTFLKKLDISMNHIPSINLNDLRGSNLITLNVQQMHIGDQRTMNIDVRGTGDLTLKRLQKSSHQTINGQHFIHPDGTADWTLFTDSSLKIVEDPNFSLEAKEYDIETKESIDMISGLRTSVNQFI